MFKKLFLVTVVAFVLTGCATQLPTMKVLWVGTYTSSKETIIDAPKHVTGKMTLVHDWQLAEQTTNITAKLGARFGFAYKFEGADSGEPVFHNVVWRLPAPGLKNPVTNQAIMGSERKNYCRVGEECLIGRSFDEPWEMVPGPWRVEIWHKGHILFEKEFLVTVPKQ